MLPTTRRLLDNLENIKQSSDYWTARCPAHDDNSNSLSVRDGDNGGTLVKCHAGCSLPQICHGAGLSVSEICPEQQGFKPSKSGKLGTLVGSYQYLDSDGALVYEACRFDKTVDGETKKTFTQRRPNGQGGWVYNMRGVTRIPYNLPDLVHGDSTEPILVVEGEKHCDRLKELGFIATCNVGGAGKWVVAYSKYLKGRDVVILPDNDDVGRKHAKKVKELSEKQSRTVNILALEGLDEKGDVLDWLAMGNTGEELRNLVESAVEHGTDDPEVDEEDAEDPLSVDVDKEIMASLGIDVLGITDRGYVKVFSDYHKRVDEIRDVDKLTLTKLLAICGPSVRSKIYEGQDDTPASMTKLKHVKQAISVLAGFRMLDEDLELGVGVWYRKDDDGKLCWVLVGAGESAVLNGELRSNAKPRFGDNILALTNNEPWYQFDQLQAAVDNYSPDFASQVCSQLEDWFSCWKFAHQDETPALLTGLVLASWIQTVWPWRPQIALSGQSSSGKSSLFNLLCDGDGGGIFGRLGIKSDSPTAAGLRQAVGNTSSIPIADELENSKDRPKLFEMLRSSGSGGQILRGSANHKAQSFGLRHMVWIGSTETGLEKEADLNRFIKISLLKPDRDESGKLPEIAPGVLSAFGVKTIVVAMRCYERAAQIVRMILESKPTANDIRIIQSFAVPAAMYAAAMGMDDQQSVDVFCSMIGITESEDDVISMQDDLVSTILGSTIKVNKEDETVSMAIMRRDVNLESSPALANAGIRILSPEELRVINGVPTDGYYLFIATAQVKRTILKDTNYKFQNISEILRRVRGAVKSKQRINGSPMSGIMIPLPDIRQDDTEKKVYEQRSGGFLL